MKKEYYVYKITNLINNKYYIGAHHGALNDGYYGSGNLIRAALKKYGIHHFKKEVLKILPSVKEMYAYEKELVTIEVVNEKNNYNLIPGGTGTIRPNGLKLNKVVVKDTNGIISEIDNTDIRFLSGGTKTYH